MPRRPSSRNRSKEQWRALLIVIPIALVILLRLWSQQAGAPSLEEGVPYRVKRVVDGDTLVLANDVRIRLIGADTPETVKPNWPVEPWGPEATQFTRDFVDGQKVFLEFDGPRIDKYNRSLAHVRVGNQMLGEELIRAGLATAKTKYAYSESAKSRFRAAESEAKAAARGIWSPQK